MDSAVYGLFFVFYPLLNCLQLISNAYLYRCIGLPSRGHESCFMRTSSVIDCFFSWRFSRETVNCFSMDFITLFQKRVF